MIWFTCKQCSKTHGRDESSAGTMLFCGCGQGVTVPWESTAPPPAPSTVPVAETPKGPDLAPIQFETVYVGPQGPIDSPKSSTTSDRRTTPVEENDEDRPYRRGKSDKRDPDYCFNHQRRPYVGTCADCGERFCADCVVKLEGDQLCSTCKNFRARRREVPPVTSSLASASLIISLIAGPLMICMVMSSQRTDAIRILSWFSLLPQILAIGLGVWALRDAERENKGGGQWVALTGVTTATLTCVMMAILTVVANRLAV